jgi:hypothetical protein
VFGADANSVACSASVRESQVTWFKVIVYHGDEHKGGPENSKQFIVDAEGKRHAILRVLDVYNSEKFHKIAVYPMDNTQIVP